jgi:glyoxylase-like metal-dependent hydrolase (beta-lactamase superfamily II)
VRVAYHGADRVPARSGGKELVSSHRFGDIEVSTVLDGYLDFDPFEFFPSVPADELRDAISLRGETTMRFPLTTFVIRTAERTMLVDTGLGPRIGRFDGACGELLNALEAAGVSPDRVDTVLFTHLHPDHVGWNCSEHEGVWTPTFANARYVINRTEWQRWAGVEAGFIARNVLPLQVSGQLDLVDDGHAPAPGVALLSTPGHTPGHVSVLLYAGGEGAVISGDALHHPVEVEHLDWSPQADDDPQLSALSRRALVERIEAEGFTLFAGHFPAPHAGSIVRVGPKRVYRALTG